MPLVATIWRVLSRRGFLTPQRQKRQAPPWRRFQAELPNECWQADVIHWPRERCRSDRIASPPRPKACSPTLASGAPTGWHPETVSRLTRANLAQRVVLVVALAGVLVLAGTYIVTDGLSGGGGGWFNYVPGSSEPFYPDVGLDPFPRFLVWLGVVIVWGVVSFWILGLPTNESSDGTTRPPSEASDR